MKNRKSIVLIALGTAALLAQQQDRVVGGIDSIDSGSKEITVHTDAGKTVRTSLAANCRLVRVEPGEKDLSKAAPIEFPALAPGDRVIVRGALSGANGESLAANLIVVMSKSSIAQQQAKEQAEWKSRGLGGVVVSIDAATREIRMKARSGGPDLKEWTVSVPESSVLKRYAENSVKFSDATPAPLSAIECGDQIRVLGARDDAQSKVVAELLVTGSFRTLGGEISSVKPESGEITMKDVQTKKPVVVRLSAETNIRRMPAFGGGVNSGGGNGAPRRRPDIAQIVDRLPPATMADLKPGDAVIVAVAKSNGDRPPSAITLVAGMDFLLRASSAQVNRALGDWTTEMSMPGQ